MARPQNAANNRLQQLQAQDVGPETISRESSLLIFAEKIAQPIGRMVPQSAEKAGKVQKLLTYAGIRSPNALVIFRALQFFSLILFPAAVATVVMIITGGEGSLLLWSAIGLMMGFLAPKVILESMVKSRQTRLRCGLADALDLMVVSVEAGLGVNQAMVRVSQELKFAHPDICDEFDFVNTEIRVGRDREEALRNLSERTGIDDLRGLCAMLIQADRFGTSIAKAIRVYSDTMRTRRRQRAEQAAQKAAVKLLFPLALFLFPTLFIVMLGPAGIQLMDSLYR